MIRWIEQLDRILRGEATRLAALEKGTVDVPVGSLTVLLVGLAMLYGACMGWFALFNRETAEPLQLLACMVKVPALFFLTLVVTFPSLYVFNALVGSRLLLPALVQLLVAGLAVTISVLASMAPIVAFFSVTTRSYPFMVLLNVVVFAVSGFLGLMFLLHTLHRLNVVSEAKEAESRQPSESAPPEEAQPTAPTRTADDGPKGPLDRLEAHLLSRHVQVVFRCWVVIFAVVGAQMSWVLRPFIGDPNLPFAWLRARDSHFFEGLWSSVRQLLG
jgi:hypothetical protein